MDEHTGYARRLILKRIGPISVASALAGCSGNGTDGTDTSTTPAVTGTATPAEGPDLDAFLSDVSNYDGVTDATGTENVTVAVGAEGNGAYFAFDPAAVRVDIGATVTWEWTGKGGSHNVSAVEGDHFRSELASEEGHTFDWTAENPGQFLYVCEPHEGAGMKGAIVVV